jgi:hypothetical protein
MIAAFIKIHHSRENKSAIMNAVQYTSSDRSLSFAIKNNAQLIANRRVEVYSISKDKHYTRINDLAIHDQNIDTNPDTNPDTQQLKYIMVWNLPANCHYIQLVDRPNDMEYLILPDERNFHVFNKDNEPIPHILNEEIIVGNQGMGLMALFGLKSHTKYSKILFLRCDNVDHYYFYEVENYRTTLPSLNAGCYTIDTYQCNKNIYIIVDIKQLIYEYHAYWSEIYAFYTNRNLIKCADSDKIYIDKTKVDALLKLYQRVLNGLANVCFKNNKDIASRKIVMIIYYDNQLAFIIDNIKTELILLLCHSINANDNINVSNLHIINIDRNDIYEPRSWQDFKGVMHLYQTMLNGYLI